jgi:chromosome segregation ATPase
LQTLAWTKRKKINELIEAINEKDELLDSQEDFLIKENEKIVKLKYAYDQEVEKCENLSNELSMYRDSISSLRNENASLVSKIEKLNICNDSISCLRDENARLKSKMEELNTCKPSTSTVEHVSICTRCRDINVEAIDDHLDMIKQQNDHIAKLTTKINEHELENEKFKFARSMLYNG